MRWDRIWRYLGERVKMTSSIIAATMPRSLLEIIKLRVTTEKLFLKSHTRRFKRYD